MSFEFESKRAKQGFTLIELMIVVAIIAVLAAIALPAYQDYVTRTQVSEGISLSSNAKWGIAEFFANRGVFPPDNERAGLAPPTSISGRYVESVTVGPSNGEITVLFGNESNASISGQTLVLEATDEGGSLSWNCIGVDPRYLPSICRN